MEELPTAEPPTGVYDPELPPRLQFVDHESLGTEHQIRCVETARDPVLLFDAAPCCDDVGCDGMSCQTVSFRCRPTYWGRVDYLYWWLDGAKVPALVTTSSTGTSRADAGILGLSTTGILFGNDKYGDQGRSGGRVEFGRWFKSRGHLGWHFSYFGLRDSTNSGRFDSSGVPILARPFFSVEPTTIGSNAELIAFPTELEGSVAADHETSFEGTEFMFRWMLADHRRGSLQLVAGYQYTGLEDDLAIHDFRRVIGGSSGFAIGTTLEERDQFYAENKFHGAALGLLASTKRGRTSLDLGLQLALGTNQSKVRITGSTTSSVPVVGGPDSVITTAGGLLALPSNIGLYEDDKFGVIPQLDLAFGYQIRPQLRAIFGYRFLYWNKVARAAKQVDTQLNLSQLDPAGVNGELRPRFAFRTSEFWAQGISAGLDYQF